MLDENSFCFCLKLTKNDDVKRRKEDSDDQK